MKETDLNLILNCIMDGVKCNYVEYMLEPFGAFTRLPDWFVDAFNTNKIKPTCENTDFWCFVINNDIAEPGDFIVKFKDNKLGVLKKTE